MVVPSAFSVVERRRPLDTSTIGRGTVIAMRWLSGSSLGRSLVGHQTLAPMPSLAVATQVLPRASLCQMKPPSQGGRTATLGFPW